MEGMFFFWCALFGICVAVFDGLRNREHRRWINKTFFGGWKD